MSDTTANTDAPGTDKPSGRVSMSKPPRESRGRVKPPAAVVPVPRTIDLAGLALAVMIVAGFIRGLLLLGNDSMLLAYVIKTNKKKPVKNFNALDSVHSLRESAFLSAIIYGVVFILLIVALRRSRSASPTRWALLIVFVFTGIPFYIIPTAGLPVPAQIVGVLIGVASVATILLVFIPPTSQKYFKECREQNLPEERRGQARPGLGSLFGPKRPRGGAALPTRNATRPATTRPAAPKAKAKVRSDTDAVAKGAELARARAKASKSRRTAD